MYMVNIQFRKIIMLCIAIAIGIAYIKLRSVIVSS